jgi:hypothetical protein
MKPNGTIYRLAEDKDIPILEALVEKNLPWTDKTPFGMPTVVAEKKGEIVGLLARNPNADSLLTEPMVAPNGVIYVRLIEAYENALRLCGFTGKNYFRVPHLADDQLKLMQKRPTVFIPSSKDDVYHWFYRRL